MNHHILQSSPLLMPALAFIAGIVMGDAFMEPSAWWALTAAAVVVSLCLSRYPVVQTVAILMSMAALGGMRASSVRQSHELTTWPDQRICYEAVVVSEAAEKPKTMGVDAILADNGRLVKCYVAKDERSRQLKPGDRLQICSRIERNREWRQGTFDYRRYMEVHGFAGQTYVGQKDWQPAGSSWEGLTLWQQVRLRFLCYRHGLLEKYRYLGADSDVYAVVAAMALGDKSTMTHELKDIYAVSGASHVLALSGLHLGIIYMLLSLLTVGRRFRLFTQLLIVTGIWSFALLVGLPSSVVRAAVMISTYALLSLAGHNRMSLNALALSAFCILLASPDSLFDVGFQLSFLAMAAILTIQPVISSVISPQRLMDHTLLRWLWGLVTVSIAAQIGTAPMVAYYFGRFATWFLITNLLVIPATTVILYLAIASLLLPVAAVALFHVVGWMNVILSAIGRRLPYASIEGLHPSALQTAMTYVIIVSVYLIVIRYDKSV